MNHSNSADITGGYHQNDVKLCEGLVTTAPDSKATHVSFHLNIISFHVYCDFLGF